ncbi:hypothetical protein WA026_019971 [Henosepilachna vigintioctopunctata]|uniref:PHD-type domain-containing protein n=1 Tax=Henosepilachna vigintioctopunctata TaxID=420089 RepID=A0AAW1V1Y4_9CUCU
MPAKCSLCSSGINHGNPGISCQGKCHSSFHKKCVGLPATCAELSDDSGFGSTCKQCRSIPNNNIPALEMGELITKMDMLLKDIILVKASQSEVIESLKFYGDKIDEFNEQMEKVRCYMKSVDGLEHELMAVKKECSLF